LPYSIAKFEKNCVKTSAGIDKELTKINSEMERGCRQRTDVSWTSRSGHCKWEHGEEISVPMKPTKDCELSCTVGRQWTPF